MLRLEGATRVVVKSHLQVYRAIHPEIECLERRVMAEIKPKSAIQVTASMFGLLTPAG